MDALQHGLAPRHAQTRPDRTRQDRTGYLIVSPCSLLPKLHGREWPVPAHSDPSGALDTVRTYVQVLDGVSVLRAAFSLPCPCPCYAMACHHLAGGAANGGASHALRRSWSSVDGDVSEWWQLAGPGMHWMLCSRHLTRQARRRLWLDFRFASSDGVRRHTRR